MMTRASIRYEWAAPCLFLFVLPITHTTPLRLVCLGIAILTTLASMRRRLPAALPRTALIAALAFWILVCLVSSAASIEPEYSWGEFRNEVIVPMIAFGVFFLLTDDEQVWRVWCRTLLASFAVVALIAIGSYLRDGNWLRSSFVGDRNAYSTYVVLIFPLFLFLWLRVGNHARYRTALIALALLALVSSAFTQNRNMWFAVASECVVFAALCWFRAPAHARRRLAIRFAVAGGLGAIAFVGILAYVVHEKAILSNANVESQARIDQDPRWEIWAYAAERIRERPATGFGYGRGILRQDFRTHFENPLKWHAHNMVVNYVIEAGVAGGIAIIGLFFALYLQSWAVYRRGDDEMWPFGAWALAMLIGITIKTATDDILVRENSILFWSLAGIIFGLCLRRQRERARFEPG